MAYYFSPYEIAALAMQIEEAGLIFYTKLSNLTRDENARKMFSYLSDQESKHKQIFEDMAKDSEKRYPEAEYVIDIRSQVETLLAFIKEKSFNLTSVTTETVNLKESVEIGIQAEIQSVSVYQLTKNTLVAIFVPVIDQIIAEEESHLAILSKYKKDYLSGPVTS
jgi:rubrerythrin